MSIVQLIVCLFYGKAICIVTSFKFGVIDRYFNLTLYLKELINDLQKQKKYSSHSELFALYLC